MTHSSDIDQIVQDIIAEMPQMMGALFFSVQKDLHVKVFPYRARLYWYHRNPLH